MKYLIPLLIALCVSLLLGLSSDLVKEVKDLKKEVRLQGKEIRANRGYIGLVDDKCDRIKSEVRHIMSGKNFIPVWDYRTFLVYDTEEVINERK